MAKTSKYNHNDIQRYLQQEMSRQEMHAFEKEMLDDPFLADAVEGFSTTERETTKRHLGLIEKELLAEKKNARIIGLNQRRFGWLKAVAIIILVIAGGAFFYLFQKKENGVVDMAQTTKEAAPSMPTQKDSVKPSESIAGMSASTANSKILPKKFTSPIITAPDGANASIAANAPPALNRLPPAAALPQASGNTTETAAGGSPALASLDKNRRYGNSQEADVKQSENTNKAAALDNRPDVDDQQKDSMVRQAELASVDQVAIASAPAPRVQAPGTARSSKTATMKTMKTEEKISEAASAQSLSIEPLGGWSNFYNYFAVKADSIRLSRNITAQKKNLKVTFKIDGEGTPYHLQFATGTDKATKKSVSDILIDGPKWQAKAKGQTLSLDLSF